MRFMVSLLYPYYILADQETWRDVYKFMIIHVYRINLPETWKHCLRKLQYSPEHPWENVVTFWENVQSLMNWETNVLQHSLSGTPQGHGPSLRSPSSLGKWSAWTIAIWISGGVCKWGLSVGTWYSQCTSPDCWKSSQKYECQIMIMPLI